MSGILIYRPIRSADRFETLVPTLSGIMIMAISSLVRDFESYLSVTIAILSGIPIITHFDIVRDFNLLIRCQTHLCPRNRLHSCPGIYCANVMELNDINVREYEFANIKEV